MCACEHREKHNCSEKYHRQQFQHKKLFQKQLLSHDTSGFAPPKETKREEVKILPFPTSFLQ
ncbi:hypothetical protein NC651_033933 [Populus alba x Populus x berolinensis]|nr:hypothetical protein NC651_033933 [Populus alba x Populus x berolinensis]